MDIALEKSLSMTIYGKFKLFKSLIKILNYNNSYPWITPSIWENYFSLCLTRKLFFDIRVNISFRKISSQIRAFAIPILKIKIFRVQIHPKLKL